MVPAPCFNVLYAYNVTVLAGIIIYLLLVQRPPSDSGSWLGSNIRHFTTSLLLQQQCAAVTYTYITLDTLWTLGQSLALARPSCQDEHNTAKHYIAFTQLAASINFIISAVESGLLMRQ